MESVIDANADAVWGSVGSVQDKSGLHELEPRTAEEWQAVRNHAITLIEATNLLIMEGRKVAAVDFPRDDVGGVLSSQEIAQTITANRVGFVQYAQLLHEDGLKMLKAIDAKNKSALMDAGEDLDAVCEACHTVFWYPNQDLSKFKVAR